ncbi:MAG: FAD-dependent oxidoreductase [Oscillospiraceae bacterium]|nr:FAD-dependent oxidoreductase [Oscillospiraceae bacterium]
MKSLWHYTGAGGNFPELKKDIQTDILVIGGGLAGLLCAYFLKSDGADVVLVEAQKICGGISGNTTAKITSQHALIYDDLINKFGVAKAKQYLEANNSALDEYRKMCENIDCDFEEKSAYVYALNDVSKITKEAEALKVLGYNADLVSTTPLPFSVAGAIRFRNQAQFNPLKFAYSISKGLNIYEHTKIRELIGTTAVTNMGRIKANKIIVATHFPFINKHGSYFMKLYQDRSYVIALENAQNVDGMYIDEAEHGLSFRNYGDLLLLGGGGHRTGKDGGNYDVLRAFARKYYPEAKEKYHWAAQDCMTLDGVPYIGHYSAQTKNLFVATGFNKWGMTSSMVAAKILCDLVQNRSNKYSDLFSPSRTMLRPQLAVNAFESVCGLLTPTTKRCPHLGCALKWNSVEHTWDCSCHGSRFEENGKLIDNPATADFKK